MLHVSCLKFSTATNNHQAKLNKTLDSIANMKEWTLEEEAANLRRLLASVGNKAQFAKEHSIPGGPSMLSQHQSGHRPISLEAGLSYAKALGVSLEQISPRLAKMVRDVPRLIESNVEPALELKKSRRVPITGSVRGGPDGYLVQDNGLDGWVEYWTGDPRAYALRVKGDSMHPRYRAGEYVVITPSIEAQSGRDVVVKLHDGNCLLKQLNWIREDEVQFVSINNGYEPMTIGLEEIECIERVAGSVGPDSMVF